MPLASGVAGERDDLPQLTALHDQIKSALDPAWERVAHLTIDKFIIDGTFIRPSGRSQESGTPVDTTGRINISSRPSSSRRASISPLLVPTGTRSAGVTDSGSLTFYTARSSIDMTFGMNRYRRDPETAAALFGMTPAGGIESLAENERDVLGALDWTDGGRLRGPVVQASTVKSPWPMLEEIGANATNVVFDNHKVIIDTFNSSPYSRFLKAAGDYFQACRHALFGLARAVGRKRCGA